MCHKFSNDIFIVQAQKELDTTSRGMYGDYYFQDSMDHSSSESQLVGTSHRSSRSQTPILHSRRLPLPPTVRPHVPQPAFRTHSSNFSLVRLFVPSFVIAAFSLITLVILVLETDYEVLGSLRRAPEMIALRRLYYEPTKEYIQSKFSQGSKREI